MKLFSFDSEKYLDMSALVPKALIQSMRMGFLKSLEYVIPKRKRPQFFFCYASMLLYCQLPHVSPPQFSKVQTWLAALYSYIRHPVSASQMALQALFDFP